MGSIPITRSNVMLSARENRLRFTATDLEVELVAAAQITLQQAGEITVPGRKLYDIVRTLPQRTQVTLTPASHQSRPHPRCHG